MGWDDPNIYYSPEAYNLETVADLDPNESYQFDTVVLFRDKETGDLYLLHDAGCSCPTPFEDKTRDDLTPCRSEDDAERFIASTYTSSYGAPSVGDTLTFMRKVREALGSR